MSLSTVLPLIHDSASLDKASRALEIPLSLGNGSAGAALETFAFGSFSPTPLASNTSSLSAPTFPLPFRHQLSFSYSGARSSLTRLLTAEPPNEMTQERKKEVAGAFMITAFEQVGEKVGLAVRRFEAEEGRKEEGGRQKLGGLVVSGGVASNLYLRKRWVVWLLGCWCSIARSDGAPEADSFCLPPLARSASEPNSTPSATPLCL